MAFNPLKSVKEAFENAFDTTPIQLGLSPRILRIGEWIEEVKPAAEAPKAAAPAAPKAPN